jgi:hypothetical protein
MAAELTVRGLQGPLLRLRAACARLGLTGQRQVVHCWVHTLK